MNVDVDLTGANWTTGRSGGNGQCVRVATLLPMMPGYVAVQDSKNGTEGPTFLFTDDEWAAHLESVRAGLYDKPQNQ